MNVPSLYQPYSVRKIMFFIFLACIPGICTKCYFFGFNVLFQIFFSIIIAVFLEAFILHLRSKNIILALSDNSAIVTGVLFGISLPSFLPLWMIFVGLFFSIVIAKHLYGGIGQNIFNPAMIGYVVLLICFPLYMSNWSEISIVDSFVYYIKKLIPSVIFHDIFVSKDVSDYFFTQATPLDQFKTYSHFSYSSSLENFSDSVKYINTSNSWKYINFSFLLGGLFLIYKNIICWRIPLGFLITLFFLSSSTFCISQEYFASPMIHFFSGGTMICAFFIATDPTTTASTNWGRFIFSIIIGFLVWVIRTYSDYPDSIAFSVLFANMIVPLIDHFIQSSGYGHNN